MQDIHSIGGGGRLFGGGGDRRLRPHQHSNHQALKCPRCDSLNTKFCYYNNYNLSQPRHFCKSCRRYWTRGGVLRNVPVGGGCRKTKRSSKHKEAAAAAAPPREQNKSNSHSSSESSSLTAAVAAEAVPESKFLAVQNKTNLSFEHEAHPLPEQGADCGIFSEIGSFTSLITSSNDPLLYGLNNVSDISQFRMSHEQPKMMSMDGDDDDKIQELTGTGGLLDQTVQAEFRSNNGGFGSLDQAMFDLPSTVDQTYWSHTQWDDQDQPNLYLP